MAALAVRFRDLDVAEDAFAEACVRAVAAWPSEGRALRDPSAWLYRIAFRAAIDVVRRRRLRERLAPPEPPPLATPEDEIMDDASLIPDDRLRLIFVCCHPSVAAETRAALTLKTVCGLSTTDIARAFLLPEPTLQQRLVRAKRKIAEAGLPFEVPGPDAWPERVDAVLSTLEIAYAKAHEDSAAATRHAGYATEILDLTRVLADLMPIEPEVLALAALVRYAEARRPARLDDEGMMVPLSEQVPARWDRGLIEEAGRYLDRALAFRPLTPRVVHATIHATWSARRSLAEPPPWPEVLRLFDVLLGCRDDPIVRLNRAVALAEVHGVAAALAEIAALDASALADFAPFHAARADLLGRGGRILEAHAAYDRALALDPPPAERRWLQKRRDKLGARPEAADGFHST